MTVLEFLDYFYAEHFITLVIVSTRTKLVGKPSELKCEIKKRKLDTIKVLKVFAINSMSVLYAEEGLV